MERLRQRFGVVIFAEVQDERFGFSDLLGKFLLCAERDQFAIVNDADAVGEFLRLFHVVRGVQNGHAFFC